MKGFTKTINMNLEGLTDEEKIYYHRIEAFLIQSLIYLKPNFKLYHLCAKIDYSTINTSKLIKRIYGVKFIELINRYRIDYFDKEIRRSLKYNEKFNITDIIKQSGFETRSLFYFKYKEIRGMSPKEFHNL